MKYVSQNINKDKTTLGWGIYGMMYKVYDSKVPAVAVWGDWENAGYHGWVVTNPYTVVRTRDHGFSSKQKYVILAFLTPPNG